MATTTIPPGDIEKERGDAAGKSFLTSLGFDAKSIDTILRVRDKIGLKDTKRSRPDLFSIASMNVVLAIAGFDVDVFKMLDLDEKERGTFQEYQKNCRFKVRRENDIVLEGPETHDAFEAAFLLRKLVLEKYPDAGMDDIRSSKIPRGKGGTECRYCGKMKEPENISWYCDDTCKKLASGGHAFQVKHLDRLVEKDYKSLITENLAAFNEKFNRMVSAKEFVAELKDVLETNPSIGKESLFFYAYYIAARKNSATYIAYHDMMSGASEEIKKWKGIKQMMLGRRSCKMENRIPVLFKKYCDLVVDQGIVNREQETKMAACFESLNVGELTFRSNPKTVAVALLCELMNKMGIKHVKKDFFEAVKMSPATVWKVRGAARFLIDDPVKYQKDAESRSKQIQPMVEELVPAEVTRVIDPPEKKNPVEVARVKEPAVKSPVRQAESQAPKSSLGMDVSEILSMIMGDGPENAVPSRKTVPGTVPTKPAAPKPAPIAVAIESKMDVSIFKQVLVETAVQVQVPKQVQADVKTLEKNVHAIYMDFENIYYIAKKMLDTRLNMDKLVELIHRAMSNVDENYDVKNVVGRSYTVRSWMSFKAVFDATFEGSSSPKVRALAGKFTWIPSPEPKFLRNLKTKRDVEVKANSDTYIVADAITDIIERSGKIRHVVIVSGDKDLVPILNKAKEKGMFITVIGYHKYTSETSRGLANKVLYLD